MSAWPELIPNARYLATGLLAPRGGDYIVFKVQKSDTGYYVKKVVARDGTTYIVMSNFLLPGNGTLRVHFSEVLGIILKGRML